jgi:DNA-binding GntR family transcriptional regulator
MLLLGHGTTRPAPPSSGAVLLYRTYGPRATWPPKRWPYLQSNAMTIDPASYEPVYRQLARILRERIANGELRPGEALPSETALSQQFGVGRDAVRDSLAALRSEGVVITTRGIGTFVRGPAAEVTVVKVGIGTRIAARVANADERALLGIPEGTAILVVTREGEPEELLPADRTVVELDSE